MFQEKGKASENNITSDSFFYEYIGYKATNIYFDIFCNKSLCSTKENIIKLTDFINELNPIMTFYMSKIEFTGSSVEKIIRIYLENIDLYISKIGIMNPSNTSIENFAKKLVDWHIIKYNDAKIYCIDFLDKLEKQEITHSNYKELENYENKIQYFDLHNMLTREEVYGKLGKSPLDKMLNSTTEILEMLKNYNKKEEIN